MCVGDIALTLDLGKEAVCYALRILCAARKVRQRKEGRTVYIFSRARVSGTVPDAHRLHRLVEISDKNARVDWLLTIRMVKSERAVKSRRWPL